MITHQSQIAKVKQKIVAGWTDGLTTREIAQSITGTKSVKGVIQASQRSAYMMAKDVSTHTSAHSLSLRCFRITLI